MDSAPPRLATVTSALDGLLTDVPTDAVGWSGPTSWWAGPLDVEGLARAAVTLSLRAAAQLGVRRGREVVYATSAERVAGNVGSLAHLLVDGSAPDLWAPLSGWFETADSWIRLHGNYPHHARVLRRVLAVTDRAQLQRVMRHLHSRETEARVREAGGIAGALRTPDEWRATEMAAALDATDWISLGPTGTRRPLPPTDGPPLAGLRVLDLTRVLAGPTCTRLLALLGADVLRIDPPDQPELLYQYLDNGSGKRSAVADLRDPLALNRIHDLLREADVLVTGYRPGALDSYGLDRESVRDRHPHVVHVSLSAWGDTGPWAGHRGFDSIVQAVSGIGHIYGATDSEGRFTPGALPVQALDLTTGYAMAAAAMALLAARPDQGAGSASLSLAATGHLLLDARPPSDARARDLDIETTTTESPHGVLTHVTGPATVDGAPLAVPSPGPYGTATLVWD